ncbi:MAG: helix-turn-helix transcriptional regulator [Myxococcales bacterium]|nr:helix-turn-helix transcriptional regulator [Myxococcales bacterium]
MDSSPVDVVPASIDSLIPFIYDAAMTPAMWPSIMAQVAALVDVPAVGLRTEFLDVGTMRQAWHGLPSDFEARYVDGAWKDDPWIKASPRIQTGRFVVGHEDLESVAPGIAKTAFVNELCRPFGYNDVMGAVLLRDSHTLVTLGMMCSDPGATVIRRAKWISAKLVPHLQRAMRIEVERVRREARSNEFSRSATTPAFWLAPDGTVLFCNHPGEQLLRRADGLQRVNGRLTTADAHEARLLARAMSARDGAAVRVSVGSGSALAVTVSPAPRESGAALRVFAVPLDGGLSTDQPQRGLERAFGLSSAEARVAVCIATGMTPKEAADHLGVAVSTARTHLLRAFEKTGVRRQADLVGLITRMAQVP